MSATEQFKNRTSQKARLIAQLDEWKDGKENPLGEDGKPAPLRMIALHVSNVPADKNPYWSGPVNASTESAILADKILRKGQEWANTTSVAGEDISADLMPFFGNDGSEGQGHYGIRFKPDRTIFGSEVPLMGDLSSPREQSSTLVRESINFSRDVTSFTGGLLAKNEDRTDRIITSLENEIKELRAYVRELESKRREVMQLENDLGDKKAARQMAERENDMKLRVMETAGNKILDYIPLFTSKLDTYLLQKFGGPTGDLSDEGKFYKEVAQIFLSRMDEDTAKEIFQKLKLNKQDIVKFAAAGSKLKLEDKRQAMHEEAKSLTRGAARPITRFLPPAGRGIPTKANWPEQPAPSNGVSKAP